MIKCSPARIKARWTKDEIVLEKCVNGVVANKEWRGVGLRFSLLPRREGAQLTKVNTTDNNISKFDKIYTQRFDES